MFKNPTIDFNALFNPLGNRTCGPPDVVLLYDGSTVHNASDQFVLLCLLFLSRLRFSSIPTDKNLICTRQIQTAVSSHPLKIGHVYMNLFTRNSPHYHLLKYSLFLQEHPVYQYQYQYKYTSLTEAAITHYRIPFFFGNFPEDGNLEAETCRKYIVE